MNRRQSSRLIVCAGMAAALGLSPLASADLTADQTPFNAYRGIWVDRFDYSVASAPSSIRTIMSNAAALGITDVMFQVRGRADAYYWNNNGLEVRAAGVTSSNDPLAIALAEGHARGINVHAWINVMPLWQAQQTSPSAYSPTAPAQHLINTNPEFWIRDSNNNPLPFPTGSTGYTIVNPARADVQTHINDVVKAIAGNYDVDGIHLDYIRLYNSNPGASNVLEFPGDAFTVSLFQQQYPGQTPQSNPANFKAFMAGRITDLVGSIRESTKAVRPDAQLTAAVWRDADIGLDEYQQDWARWIDSGLLDAAMPMIYRKGFGSGSLAGTSSDPGDLYRLNVTEGLNRRGTSGVMVGVGSYMQNDAATAYANVYQQLVYARSQGANGIQLFDYGTLFNNSAASNEAKRAIADFFAANSAAPAITSLGDFEIDEGTFKWSATYSGSNRNVASTSAADRVSGQGHSGGGSQQITINKTAGADSFILRHVSGTAVAADPGSNTPFASIGSVGMWLKTTTPDLQVSLALDDPSTGDRGYLKNVIPDGQWHRYEWSLADPTHWDAWVGGSDGHLGVITTIDSVQFFGTADQSTIYLDDLFYDAAARAADQWTLDADGAWNNSGHWTGGAPGGVGRTASLLRRATGDRTITLDAPVTLGTLVIDNSSSYTIAGGGANQLTLDDSDGAAEVRVINRGAHTIAAPILLQDSLGLFVDRGSALTLTGAFANPQGRSVIKSGDGTLEVRGQGGLGAAMTFSAQAGTTRFLVGAGADSAIVVGQAATVAFAADQSIHGLTVADQGRAALLPGAAVLAVRALSIASQGQVELGAGALVQDYPDSGDSPLLATRDHIRDGRIISSAAQGALGLGYAEAADVLAMPAGGSASFMGQSVDSTSVLVRLTLRGDATLNGIVDFADLVRLAQHYNTADGSAVWAMGDFTHDGNVNFSDLVMLAQNYNGAMPAGAFSGSLGDDLAAAFAEAPEPSGLAMAVMGLGMLGRRRRRG